MNVPSKPASIDVETHGNFIDGREVEAGNGAMLDVRNPATGDVIARIPNSTAEDIDRAMKSARAAFDGKAWGGMDTRARARLVRASRRGPYRAARGAAAMIVAGGVPGTSRMRRISRSPRGPVPSAGCG